MAPILRCIISSGSKKKEPSCACMNEAKVSHSHKMCTEVSSSVPHFLQVGLLLNPITYRCLLRVLCPVRRPGKTLDCALWKDSNRAFVAGLGPEIHFGTLLIIRKIFSPNPVNRVLNTSANLHCQGGRATNYLDTKIYNRWIILHFVDRVSCNDSW